MQVRESKPSTSIEIVISNRWYRRAKYSHDPNNTAWSRSTTSYGHKQLLSQGWTPGQNLGATNVPHTKFHTEANASHIRVVLRDDNLGLGAKRGSGQLAGECTGLDSFQNLLGRLNGKSQEVLEKEQKGRDHVKKVMYVEKRWGGLNFVSGGLLVGDKVWGKNVDVKDDIEAPKQILGSDEVPKQVVMIAEQTPEEVSEGRSKRMKSKKERRAKRRAERQLDESEPIIAPQGLNIGTVSNRGRTQDVHIESEVPDVDLRLKKKRQKEAKELKKAEKVQKRLDRIERREAKRAEEVQSMSASSPAVQKMESSKDRAVADPVEASKSSAPSVSFSSGRHAIRQRYIRSKQMALLDPKALNEVSFCRVETREAPYDDTNGYRFSW